LTVAGTVAAPVEFAARAEATPGQGPQAVQRAAVAAAAREVVGASVALGEAGALVRDLVDTIHANRGYLSEIDGLIGDGDHGINMSKGFTGCAARLDAMGEGAQALPAALQQLSQALMDDIGGSMGPLYGHFFLGLADTLAPHARLDAGLFGDALAAAVARVQALGNAQVGDKTLMDTLAPALAAYREALAAAAPFDACLQAMADAAEAGKESTRALQARIGRSARLGARSIGVLDAGATSCCLLLLSMARSLRAQLAA
jgi:dihydroxyacetone kinase